MAYVFGVEGIPIFEMLFVVSLLLLLGLVFILLELKKLNALIAKEKKDLKRFEDDLAKFEVDAGKKSTQRLVDYVKNAMARGLSEAQIKVSLIQRGWSKREIDNIFEGLKK